jgi:hypothetical protein
LAGETEDHIMRDNSGQGESKNNNHDPTLKELEGKDGPAQQSADMPAESFDIAGNAKQKGEQPSPGNRARGETSLADPAPGTDNS